MSRADDFAILLEELIHIKLQKSDADLEDNWGPSVSGTLKANGCK